MNMRFLISLLALLLICPPVHAQPAAVNPYAMTAQDKASLDRVQAYLNHIRTVSAGFTQVAPDGGVSQGMFYLRRPGKLRMEYAPPTPVLMVTSGSSIVYYDKELDQVSRIPLDSTLVGFLARDAIEFDDTVIITGFETGEHTLRISLVQAKRPKDGMLTLEFSDNPLVLHNMIVTDGSGQTTTVSLTNARFDIALDPDLFVFHDPHLGGKNSIEK